MKKALIFGITGQMGSYLAELLFAKGYKLFGTSRLPTGARRGRWIHYHSSSLLENDKCMWAPVDVGSRWDVSWVLERIGKVDEVYNMAAMMYAPKSWEQPVEYLQTNGMAAGIIAHEVFKRNPEARFFQAGSADVFGKWISGKFLNEENLLHPETPYGVAKAMAQEIVRVYREKKGRFACTGIFFNAESPRRSDFFFAAKVARTIAQIRAGYDVRLDLEKVHARRDWGLAQEYVEAAWLMLQADQPRDYVIATGVGATCQQFLERAMAVAGIQSHDYRISFRPSGAYEVDDSYGSPGKIRTDLGWQAKTRFPEVVDVLVKAEMEKLSEVHSQPVR